MTIEITDHMVSGLDARPCAHRANGKVVSAYPAKEVEMSCFMRRFLRVVLAVGVLISVGPAPAHADTLYLDILYIRCVEQSEPFSDEIRLRVNGQIHGMWNDVDTSEIHWYWSSGSSASPLDIPFSGGSVLIDILEEDDDLNLIGSLEVPASMVNTGEHEMAASMSDGFYSIRFSVSTTP